MQNILITGSAGFIGSHLTDSLLCDGHTVIGVDNLNDYYNPKWKLENISRLRNDKYIFIKEDILNKDNLDTIFKKYKPDIIIHLAARAGVRPSITDPHLYQKVNIEGTLNLLELSRKYDIKKFIFASSSSVYGNQEKVPFSESDNVMNPISPYAATKLSTELLAYTYSHLHKFSTIGLRFFTVYGPFGRPDMAPYMFTESIIKGKTISKYGNGETSRDYTYIDDIVSGIKATISFKCDFEIFNLGNNTPITLNKFIHTLENIIGKKAIIETKVIPLGDVNKTYADISKAAKHLGYIPKTSFESGLTKLVAWYRNHRLD